MRGVRFFVCKHAHEHNCTFHPPCGKTSCLTNRNYLDIIIAPSHDRSTHATMSYRQERKEHRRDFGNTHTHTHNTPQDTRQRQLHNTHYTRNYEAELTHTRNGSDCTMVGAETVAKHPHTHRTHTRHTPTGKVRNYILQGNDDRGTTVVQMRRSYKHLRLRLLDHAPPKPMSACVDRGALVRHQRRAHRRCNRSKVQARCGCNLHACFLRNATRPQSDRQTET